ncbi:hypothetical protein RJ639_032536 [Escallonia herrerae]|uniref:Gag protein n=1 Tax=Escallonia herrerae TaxID=1293975 RepID=A0AA88WY69_9ASTE|nr:hypothetical protein RJ639_032536 [Escallonia herrerae]
MATSETNPESGPVNPNMQHSGGTVHATPYVAPAHGSVGLGERSEKFNGKVFKRWQQKMLFYLTTLNLARFLQEDAPDLGENPDRQTMAVVDAWKHSDFLCKNYILNGLDNALYNVYSPMVNAKALWESLERKYKTEDAGSKKFVVGKFLDFKMLDSKTLILHDINAEGMVLGESFQVAALIEKLSPTWKDFKNYLKHKYKEMKLEDLIVRLRIEEDNRQSEKKAGNYHQEAKANVVEQVTMEYQPPTAAKEKRKVHSLAIQTETLPSSPFLSIQRKSPSKTLKTKPTRYFLHSWRAHQTCSVGINLHTALQAQQGYVCGNMTSAHPSLAGEAEYNN